MKSLVITVVFCISYVTLVYTQNWSFAVVADPRNEGATFKNALIEIRDMKANPDQKLSPAEFVIVVGDIDPVSARYNNYRKIFKKDTCMKAFYPVKGNHDVGKHARYIVKKILPHQDSITIRDSKYANYYVDWKNIRFIIVDQYSDLGSGGCINKKGRKWVEELIRSAYNFDHVFICFHEPAFPRLRHLNDSFNACREERDAFWNMIVKYNTKVKAIFNGHIHYYHRMRVADPESKEAQDTNAYPDHEDGVYQVNCGATGQGDRNTVVRVQINNTNVSFVVLDAENGKNKPFHVIDEWEIVDTTTIGNNEL